MSLLSNDAVADYIAASSKAAWSVPDLPKGTPLRAITKVSVIGASTMGGGISMNFASVGIPVTIVEQKREALELGLGVIRRNYQRSADKGRFAHEEVDLRMGRITGALSIDALNDCDLMIEAVFENMDHKKHIFLELDRVAKQGAIMASNTSALDIDEIAAITKRTEDVIGLHFFSPANVMKLLEIVRAEKTADDVIATVMQLAQTIDKIAVLVGGCPAFVGNRMLFARQGQGQKLMYKGVMPWDIDAAMNAFGFKMGNFQMSDLAGLDIGWSKGAPTDNPIRDALCEMDRRGQKTKAGFYYYDENRKATPSDITEKIIRGITGVDRFSMAPDQIIETCIYPMIKEAVKILEENKAQRPSDIDVVWLKGYGWPVDKGGPIYYADKIGASANLEKMEELKQDDPAYAPAQMLKDLAKTDRKFSDIDTGGLKTDKS